MEILSSISNNRRPNNSDWVKKIQDELLARWDETSKVLKVCNGKLPESTSELRNSINSLSQLILDDQSAWIHKLGKNVAEPASQYVENRAQYQKFLHDYKADQQSYSVSELQEVTVELANSIRQEHRYLRELIIELTRVDRQRIFVGESNISPDSETTLSREVPEIRDGGEIGFDESDLIKIKEATSGIFKRSARRTVSHDLMELNRRIKSIESLPNSEQREKLLALQYQAQIRRHAALQQGATSYGHPNWAAAAVCETWVTILIQHQSGTIDDSTFSRIHDLVHSFMARTR